MFKVADLFVGKRLFVGCAIPSPVGLGVGPTEIRGSGYIEGPLLVGSPISYNIAPNVNEANLMVARCTNVEALPPPPSIFKISSKGFPPTPIDVVIGDFIGPVGVTIFCGPMPFSVQATSINLVTLANYSLISPTIFRLGTTEDIGAKVFSGAEIKLSVNTKFSKAINFAPVTSSTVPANYSEVINKITNLTETFGIAVKKKPFDILHPTKEGHRLRYVSLEGPSAEVYIRGKLKNQSYIELPDYWKGLVDLESITVNLTAIGLHQELFYEEVEWGSRIKVVNAAGGPIHCSYTVFAERKDTSKNIPEYKGLTPNDYPGDNSEYRLN